MNTDKQFTVIHITNEHCAFDDRIFYKELLSLSKKYNCYELCAIPDGRSLMTMGGEKRESGEYGHVHCIPFKGGSRNFVIRSIRYFLPFIYNPVATNIFFSRIIRIVSKEKIKPDLIHFHDLSFAPIAIRLKNKLKCKLIFDSHEFFFSYPFAKGLNLKNCFTAIIILLRWKKAVEKADFTIGCTKTMDNLISLIRKDDNHGIVYNSSIFNLNIHNRSLLPKEKIVLLHEGSMPFNRGLKLMLEMFRDDYIKEHFQLRIVGTIKGKEQKYYNQKLHEYNLNEENIYFTGWVDYLDVPKALKGDIGILFFEKVFNAFYGMPNKIFNYHVVGVPVLATHCADLSDIIENKGTGVVVERNVESVKKGLMKLVEHYDEYQSHVLEHQKEFHWSSDEERLFCIYERVLS